MITSLRESSGALGVFWCVKKANEIVNWHYKYAKEFAFGLLRINA